MYSITSFPSPVSNISHFKARALELMLLLLVLKLETCRTDLLSLKLVKIEVPKGDGVIINKSFLPIVSSKSTSKSPENMSHFEGMDQTSVYSDEGTISIQPDIQIAFRTCYMAPSRTNLLIFIYSNEHFLEAVRKISKTATQLREEDGRRYSYCDVYIFNQTCHHTPPQHKVEDFHTSVMKDEPRRDISTRKVFPFDWLSDLYLIQYCDSRQQLKFWEIYSAKDKLFINPAYQQEKVKMVGLSHAIIINVTEFLLNNNTKLIRRQNLGGVDMVASVFLKEDDENDNGFEVEIGKTVKGEDVLVSGLSVNIFRDFGSILNFTEKVLKIYFGADNFFISAFTSEEHQFDINLFHSSVTKNRSDVAQPLHPTFFDGVHAIFVQPTDQSVRNIYVKPFASRMWQVLLFTWSCIFLSCKLVMFLRIKLLRQNDDTPLGQDDPVKYLHMHVDFVAINEEADDEEDEDSSAFEAAFWCIAAICQQGWERLPTATPLRIIFMTSLTLSVVCYSAFTGKIVSELWSVPKPIKSLKQLLSHAHKVYLVEASDTSYDVLEGLEKRSPDVLEKIEFHSIDQIYPRLVRNPGRTCVITWPDTVTSFIQRIKGINSNVDAYICETFPSFNYQPSSSLFVPKNSEFESLFNYRIIAGLERGFIRRYWNTYKRESFLSCLENNVKVTTLDFGHVFFAFFVLLSGMIVSVLLLISELTMNKIGWKIRLMHRFSPGASRVN